MTRVRRGSLLSRAFGTLCIRLARVGLVAGAIAILLGAAMLGAIVVLGPREDAEPSDAVVVLGAAVWPGGRPSPALYARTARGAELVLNGTAPVLVVTGGLGWNPPAEAVVMQRTALALGVPAERIVVEGQARSTAESARLVGAMSRHYGWRRIVVVTDPFHTVRARWLFRAEGLSVTQAPTADTYYSGPTRLRYQWRESLAIVATILQRPGLLLQVG